jgi:hypothetical protein
MALLVGTVGRQSGLWNDFASYWLAGKLVAAGHSPYDLAALIGLGAKQGIAFQAGTGYSYPLPFAVSMVPLSALPFPVAGAIFSVGSIAVFAWAVANWLGDSRLSPGSTTGTLVPAVLAGFYPPVIGSAFFGQANLLVLGLLAFGVKRWLWPDAGSDRVGGVAIGLAGIVKVAPLALLLSAALARRLGGVVGILVGAGVAMAAALAAVPYGLGGAGRLADLGTADSFWTNQSLNGFISRLTIRNERTSAFLRGSVDPTLAAWVALAVFAALTLAVLWRARDRLGDQREWWLAIGFTLVAAVIAAPKDSFWNHVPALVAVGLLIAVPSIRRDALTRGLLLAWYGLAWVQFLVDHLSAATLHGWGPIGAILSSSALLGMVALWFALGGALLRPQPPVD